MISGRRSSKRVQPTAAAVDILDAAVPSDFRCPISLDLMKDPVTAPSGITYDRENIESWLNSGRSTCPVSGEPIKQEDLIPNHTTRRMIQQWCVANRTLGVERIPTPKIPVSPADAGDLLTAVAVAAHRGDAAACRRIAARLESLGRESERNRRCIVSSGAPGVLSTSFAGLSGEPMDGAGAGALEAILSALVVFFPLDDDARRRIASPASMKSIVSMLRSGSSADARTNAVVVLRELVSSTDPQTVQAMARTNGLSEALCQMIAKPVSAAATKAALVTAYFLSSGNEKAAARLADLGIVSSLMDLLVDAPERGVCEKALTVVDSVAASSLGREKAREHALTVPVLVKKMFRVSDMATEFAVSALWRLCKSGAGKEQCIAEAVQVGAFQKLLLLLQVGCGGVTKERASELLKLLNASRAGAECVESGDFRGIKRSL